MDLKTKLLRDINQAQQEMDLIERFPDLREHTNRWKNRRLCSKSINPECDQFEIRRTCGCCTDCGVLVVAHKEIDGRRIYTDPPELYIATQNYDYGWDMDPDWKGYLRKNNINEELISRVEKMIPNDDDEDDEDG